MKIKLTILFLLTNLASHSQNCKIEKSSSIDDTLNVLLNYEYHLFCNASLNFKKKLASIYCDENKQKDSCYIFLIPDSLDEFISDGDFISQHIHQSTLDKQCAPLWIEVSKLNVINHVYHLTITTNKMKNGKKVIVKRIHYRVRCQEKSKDYRFRRRLF